MNFIVEFSLSNREKSAFDAILIIVNKYIKMAKYISAKMNWKIENLTNVFHQKVFSNYKMSDNIVMNKNILFIFHFWSVFCYHFLIKHHYNTAFYSQTNDQTKHQNSTLKQYLRNYVNYQQNDWIQWLSFAEFAYNNSVHSTTDVFSFKTMYEWNFKFVEKMQISRTKLQVPATRKHVKNVISLKKILENKWQLTWKQQTKNYDKRRITQKYYVKNKVWLNAKNINSIKSLKKLDYKFLKPFEIIKLIEFKTYMLQLFKIMRDIYFIFHMFLFKSYKESEEENPSLLKIKKKNIEK